MTVLLVAAGAPPAAHAQRRAVGTASVTAGQQVQLPYVMRDSVGVSWDIQMDGACGDGGNDLYDGGGRVDINSAVYQAPQPSAVLDAATNELVMPQATLGGLTLTRRVAVNVAGGWCRWTEVLENPSNAPVRATVHLHWDLGNSNQQNRPIEDEKGKVQLGVAIFDGARGLAMLCAGRGAKVSSRYQMQQGSDQIEQYYELDLPARKTVAIAHFQAMRANIDGAAAFIGQTREKDLLEGMPKDVRRALVNFKRSDGLVVGDVELPRAELLDTVELKTGDQYLGELRDATFKLDTFHGRIELPVDRVIGMVTVGKVRPSQLFVTGDGEMIGGSLAGGEGEGGTGGAGLRFRLSSGQDVVLPLATIAKVGCRKRMGEPEEWRFDKPMAYLRDGQRLAVEPPAGPIAAGTVFGQLDLKPEWIASLVFHGEDRSVHQVRLRDGSRFNALIAGDALAMKLRAAPVPLSAAAGFGGVSPGLATDPVRFPLSTLARVQLAPLAGGDEPGVDLSEVPTLTLRNGDLLVGTVQGTLEVETGFDVLRLNGSEVRGVRRSESPDGRAGLATDISVTMWDGAVVSGGLKGNVVTFAPTSGPPLPIPVTLLGRYAHPNPVPPPPMVAKIRAIVAELSSPEFKTRERAAGQLRSIGQGAAVVLKDVRDAQPAEAQKIIDAILKAVEQEKAEAAKKTAAANAPGPARDGPAFQGGLFMQQQEVFNLPAVLP